MTKLVYYTYIIHSNSLSRYYIGQTNDLKLRMIRHNEGKVLSTMKGCPWELILSFEKPSRSEAVQLERKLKNLNKERLKAFIVKYS